MDRATLAALALLLAGRSCSASDGTAGAATPYVLMYDNEVCHNSQLLSESLGGIGSAVVDAAQCGAIAAADDRCNPDFVFVRTMVPFKNCYCAVAGDPCTKRGTNSEYATFVPQAYPGSPALRAPTSPTPAPPTAELTGEEYCQSGNLSAEECERSACCHWNTEEPGEASNNGSGRCWSNIGNAICVFRDREACDEHLVVSGSSLHTTVMGVYAQTGVMQSGRPVYEISGPETAYLYFSEAYGDWNIGPSYYDGWNTFYPSGPDAGSPFTMETIAASVWFYSFGTGADASCPVDVPTWTHWDEGTWEVADGITVVNGTKYWDEATGTTWSIVGTDKWCSGSTKRVGSGTDMSLSQCQAAVLGDPDCGIYMMFNGNVDNGIAYCTCTLDREKCGMRTRPGSSAYVVHGATCQGDAATWHSGSGPCSWYAPGHSSELSELCHEDGDENGGVNDGLAAIHVCSECGACTERAPTPAPLEVEDLSAAPRAGGAGTLLAAFLALLLTGGGALGTGP